MKGSKGAVEVVLVAVPPVTVPTLGPGLPRALGPEPDMVKVTGGEPEVGGEPKELEDESECGLGGGLTQRRWERSKSTNRKLRVKAKNSPGQTPWRHNDDGRRKTNKGREV